MYRKEFAQLLKLAVPLVLAHLAQNSLSFIDTLMVGYLGKDAIAGILLGSTTFFLVTFVLAGVLLGVNPIVSQAFGAGDEKKIGAVVRQGILVSCLMLIPSTFILRNGETIFRWLDQPLEVSKQSSEYLKAISWGILPAFIYSTVRSALEGMADTRPILCVSLLSVLLNIGANYVLMFGYFGFPALGLVGTGYASALVMTISSIALGGYFLVRYRHLQIFSWPHFVDRSTLVELLKIGVPIGMTIGFEVAMFSAASFSMGYFTVEMMAAHQIAVQSASLAFMVPLGIAIAMSVRVGEAAGSGDLRRAQVAGYVGMMAAVAVMCVSATVFLLLPKWVVSAHLDLSDPENAAVIQRAVSFLSIAAVFQVFDGLQVAGSNALRGLKDTRAAMLLTLLAYLGFGVTSGAVLGFGLGFEGEGIWCGLTIGLAAASVLLTVRFRWHFREQFGVVPESP